MKMPTMGAISTPRKAGVRVSRHRGSTFVQPRKGWLCLLEIELPQEGEFTLKSSSCRRGNSPREPTPITRSNL